MSGGLPFLPEPVPRTAPEVDGLGLQRLLEGVGIHEAEHEHGAVPPILHDSRDQALIIEFEMREVHGFNEPLPQLLTLYSLLLTFHSSSSPRCRARVGRPWPREWC